MKLQWPSKNFSTLREAQEHMVLAVRRELAIEDFLMEIERRYRRANLDPPFTVLPIDRNPELLKRGIIVQKSARGNSLYGVSRQRFDRMVPPQPHHYKPPASVIKETKSPLHQEVIDRIPEMQEMMQIFNRYESSIHVSNMRHYNQSPIGGTFPYVNRQGKLTEGLDSYLSIMGHYLKTLPLGEEKNHHLNFLTGKFVPN